jgi:hypothetical protein
MDIEKVLVQLREELENIDTAILSLERLHRTGTRRGRPPAWLAQAKSAVKSSRKNSSNKKDDKH